MTEFTAAVTEITIYPRHGSLDSELACSVVLMDGDVRLLGSKQGIIHKDAWDLIKQAVDNLMRISDAINIECAE